MPFIEFAYLDVVSTWNPGKLEYALVGSMNCVRERVPCLTCNVQPNDDFPGDIVAIIAGILIVPNGFGGPFTLPVAVGDFGIWVAHHSSLIQPWFNESTRGNWQSWGNKMDLINCLQVETQRQ